MHGRTLPLALAALSLALAACPVEDRCPAGQTRCGGVCRDLDTDVAACGGCGRICALGASCNAGQCECPAGEEVCLASGGAQACVDLQADEANCGACGEACGLGTCNAGACACDADATSCAALDPECRDLQRDPGACGACDTPCTRRGETCQAGACACPASRPTACDPPEVEVASCVDLTSDPTSCGACGHACTLLNAVCEGSACACPASLPTACPAAAPTACVNLTNDTRNCGACGERCATGASCAGGDCACPGATPDVCSGTCVDRQTSEAHCGTCGHACGAGETCLAGGCCTTCPSGGCQTVHSNGLGGEYRDCNPLGSYTLEAAERAARSWAPGGAWLDSATGQYLCPSPACRCMRDTANGRVAIWCWGDVVTDPMRGRVEDATGTTACQNACPGLASPTWN